MRGPVQKGITLIKGIELYLKEFIRITILLKLMLPFIKPRLLGLDKFT